MKVFIAVDMEGATGVAHREHLLPGGNDYERARKWLTGDVNAAVEGAVAAGATEVLVNDGHGNMRNVIIDDLEKLVKQGEQGEAFQKDFDELLALGQKVADARIAFYNEVRGLLSPQQVAKFLVFERNFNRDLRDIIQDVQRERRREFRPR